MNPLCIIAAGKTYLYKNIKMLVFDMAGTTVNEGGLVYKTLYETIKNFGLDKSGYRLITNDGENANQEVAHFHIHILGGENLGGLR